jgi:hypothetical protein
MAFEPFNKQIFGFIQKSPLVKKEKSIKKKIGVQESNLHTRINTFFDEMDS